MLTLEFEQGGKKKKIERRLMVRCILCGATLQCTNEDDPWGWLNTEPQVKAFYAEHRAHGGQNTVGAELQVLETE